MADALSRRHALITIMDAKVMGFKHIKAIYEADPDFQEVYKETSKAAYGAYYQHDGYACMEFHGQSYQTETQNF